jgi:hypothetical protein
MLCVEIVPVCSENQTKPINTLCGTETYTEFYKQVIKIAINVI